MQVLAKKSAPRRQAGEPPPPASSFTFPAPEGMDLPSLPAITRR